MAIHRHRRKGLLARALERFAKPAPQPAKIEVHPPSMSTSMPDIMPPGPDPMPGETDPPLVPSWAPSVQTIQDGTELTLEETEGPTVHRTFPSRLTSDAFRRMRTGGAATPAEPQPWSQAELAAFAEINEKAFGRLPQPQEPEVEPFSYAPSLLELQLRARLETMESLAAISGPGVQGLQSAAFIQKREGQAAILKALADGVIATAHLPGRPANHGPSYLRPNPSR